MIKPYLVYNPNGTSYISSLKIQHPIFEAKDADYAIHCMNCGISVHMTQDCAHKIIQKSHKFSEVIRETLFKHGYL